MSITNITEREQDLMRQLSEARAEIVSISELLVIMKDQEVELIKRANKATAERDALKAQEPVGVYRFLPENHLYGVTWANSTQALPDNTKLYLAAGAQPDQSTLLKALRLAVRQNSHDMVMTGEEIRLCEAAMKGEAA